MAEQPVTFTLTKESEAYIRELQVRLGRDVLYGNLVEFFDRQANIVAGRTAKRAFTVGDNPLRRRTGTLGRSIIGRGELVGGLPAMRVGIFRGPALKYAGPLELGTKGKNPDSPYPTIKPKNAKALAVPLDDGPAVTPAGVHRYDSPRNFPTDLHFVPILRGRVVGLLVTEDDEAAYLLLRAMDIAPRFYLREGMLESLPEVSEKLAKFLAAQIAGNN